MKLGPLEVRLVARAGELSDTMLGAARALEVLTVVTSGAAKATAEYNRVVRWLRRGKHRWRIIRRPRLHTNSRRRPKRARRGR